MEVAQAQVRPSRRGGSRLGALVLALWMGATACVTGTLQGTAETREAEAFIAPLPTDFQPVRVEEAELTAALAELVLRLPLRVANTPRVYVGRRLAQVGTLPEPRGKRPTALKLQGDYARYCAQRGTPGDCLTLLEDGPVLQADDLRAVALAMAVGPAMVGANAELKGLLNPTQVLSTVSFALATYLALLVLPEPVSKGVAAFFTVWLWGYLGWEFFELLRAYGELRDEAPKAASFAELQQVGERFGRIIGPNSVRVLVLLGTTAVGGGLGPAAKGPRLPGMGQVSRMAQVRLGPPLAEVLTATEGVMVSVPAGTIRLVLAPNAVAMAARGQPPPKVYRAWKSFSGFKRAMGPAGSGKQWHHIVEQTPGNVSRFGGEALHNTENVIALDKALHERVSSFFSSYQFKITNSNTLTVRQWIGSQSYQAQLDFGSLVIKNISEGVW